MTSDIHAEPVDTHPQEPGYLYMAWAAAEAECAQALHAWFTAGRGERVLAYDAYRTALDREAAAADDLQRGCENDALVVSASAA